MVLLVVGTRPQDISLGTRVSSQNTLLEDSFPFAPHMPIHNCTSFCKTSCAPHVTTSCGGGVDLFKPTHLEGFNLWNGG